MLVKCYASAVQGISASTVTVEVDISPGINIFLVGLPDSAVKESQRRIESALRSIGVLPMAIHSRDQGFKGIILPYFDDTLPRTQNNVVNYCYRRDCIIKLKKRMIPILYEPS